jgi:hypothetical protein
VTNSIAYLSFVVTGKRVLGCQHTTAGEQDNETLNAKHADMNIQQ